MSEADRAEQAEFLKRGWPPKADLDMRAAWVRAAKMTPQERREATEKTRAEIAAEFPPEVRFTPVALPDGSRSKELWIFPSAEWPPDKIISWQRKHGIEPMPEMEKYTARQKKWNAYLLHLERDYPAGHDHRATIRSPLERRWREWLDDPNADESKPPRGSGNGRAAA